LILLFIHKYPLKLHSLETPAGSCPKACVLTHQLHFVHYLYPNNSVLPSFLVPYLNVFFGNTNLDNSFFYWILRLFIPAQWV